LKTWTLTNLGVRWELPQGTPDLLGFSFWRTPVFVIRARREQQAEPTPSGVMPLLAPTKF
jgi:hypothetical protein